MTRIRQWGAVLGLLFFLGGALITSAAADGILQIHNGYFWDPSNESYFVPRGIAYQCWNPPVGANQSFDQVDYDLLEFKKMYANSVRCEFVWSQVQTGTNTWDFSKPDHLVQEAEKLGLKLFVIIGFQYPPSWFPPEWRAINDQGLTPDVLQCLQANRNATIANPLSVTNCLSKPIYDHLYTNQLPAGVIANVLSCLTSSVPAEIVGALEEKISPDALPLVLSAFISDVINYEHPDARRVYTNYFARVVDRYKNSTAIGAWITGNECAYFDLWEDFKTYQVHRFIGYDPYSQAAFRNFLRSNYNGDISALNANWQTSYTNFDSVVMPGPLPEDRNLPGLTDTIHWRQQSIGGFIASGALTARTFDPNHLLTYSMVGGIFNGRDANNTCEDAVSIVGACKAAGAKLDFWSINNYAWASFGSELRTGDWGISKYRQLLHLPVMISETGHSSTEDLFSGAGPRQAKAVPGQVWESLMSGAIGTHIFHWNDRNQFTQFYFNRERGFGIVNEDRSLKVPVYYNVLDMFRRMQDVQIERLLANSADPPFDVQFFWSKEGDLGWPRANQENAMLWGALRRVGLQPGIITDTEFQAKAYTNAPVLLLSRGWQLKSADLDTIATDVINAGIHVHANGDLPGQFDAYLHPNANWASRMNSLFGLNVANAIDAYDSESTIDATTNLQVNGSASLGALTPTYFEQFYVWKIWHGLRATAGTTLLTDTGLNGTQTKPPVPGLQLTVHGRAKAAVNTFPLGDIFPSCTDSNNVCARHLYEIRYDILSAIYLNHFGITPVLNISGDGAKQVIPDYRICPNGSVLISILNEDTNTANISLSAPTLLVGKTVENLTSGGVITTNCNGTLGFSMAGDDYLLLYVYGAGNAVDASLINPRPEKVWVATAPLAVWPRGSATNIAIAYDIPTQDVSVRVNLEQIFPYQRVFAQSALTPVSGRGTNTLQITVPDPDLNDPEYMSSANGAAYVFHAMLEQNGNIISETTLPVRLLWGIAPAGTLPTVAAGGSYQVALDWEELPSYQPDDPTPMDRALLWDSLNADAQHFNLTLQLQDASGQTVASDLLVTDRGSGTNLFTINVPSTAHGPFSWTALVQSAPGTKSIDIDDSFEGRNRGEDLSPFNPWFGYSYPTSTNVVDQGVIAEPGVTPANQVAYMVVSNPPNPDGFSGFGLIQSAQAPFALPADHRLWSQYVFSFSFKETNGLRCALELQLKDTNNNWIQFTQPYNPGTNSGWNTISQTLDQFTPGSAGPFDPSHALTWALNIRMLQTNVTYTGYFDNVLFTGQPSLADDFEDRQIGNLYDRLAPAVAYGYDANNSDDVKLNDGVQLDEHSDGTQAAFVVAQYKVNSGAYAGFLLLYPFAEQWSLPADTNRWRDYSFSFDFKERDGLDAIMEMQVGSPDTIEAPVKHAIHFTKPYVPGSNNWDTVSATLDQFVPPGYDPFGPFDSNRVSYIVVNIQMLQTNPPTNVLYVAYIDNIRFHGPPTPAAGQTLYGYFSTADDSFRIGSASMGPGGLTITWTGSGVVYSATKVDGPWTPTGATTSPATIPITQTRQFFQLRR